MKEVLLNFYYFKFSFLPILGLTAVVYRVTVINLQYCYVQLQVGVTVLEDGIAGLHNSWIKSGRKYKTV